MGLFFPESRHGIVKNRLPADLEALVGEGSGRGGGFTERAEVRGSGFGLSGLRGEGRARFRAADCAGHGPAPLTLAGVGADSGLKWRDRPRVDSRR